ncbi:MAG: GIY-YIG nuclease family protein, partial [Ureaplasma sp.]|nr:GIY-YIG nuclease family protein [Ureaplasma sp.]
MSNKIIFNETNSIFLETTSIENNIMKEFYFPEHPDIKMFSFSKLNYEWLSSKINEKDCVVYFLLDENEKSIYIGQTVGIINRLKDHNIKKSFTKAILFSSDNWTDVIIKNLESKFIDLFKSNENNIFSCINSRIESERKHKKWEKQIIDKSLEVIIKLL